VRAGPEEPDGRDRVRLVRGAAQAGQRRGRTAARRQRDGRPAVLDEPAGTAAPDADRRLRGGGGPKR
jgi:hypothetical protein